MILFFFPFVKRKFLPIPLENCPSFICCGEWKKPPLPYKNGKGGFSGAQPAALLSKAVTLQDLPAYALFCGFPAVPAEIHIPGHGVGAVRCIF